ncbi:MAG: orotate phosphoribosyltransferase [Planctomycetes bacterium]|nr:orotate phosphoribosyltransferase [Planctomycetota bacterium]MCB9891287.1 orotate phosphoribosyltransferase [Planctomycetota bacterium]MCB9919454.1 orotate phosphoribosyltransferase [Planctomycetota bacterium]
MPFDPSRLTYDRDAARSRLLTLVRERAYKDGVDIVLASGKRSDFYINGKRITLHPEGLFLFASLLLDDLETIDGITAVGGMAIGADPISAAIATLSWLRDRPLDAFLVRKEAKGHGTGSRIEGELGPKSRVAIVEDTITTGGSSRKAIEAVRETGAEVVCVLALVDREDEDGESFRKEFDVRPIFKLSELRGHA